MNNAEWSVVEKLRRFTMQQRERMLEGGQVGGQKGGRRNDRPLNQCASITFIVPR